MQTNFNWDIKPFKIEDVISMIQNKELILRPEYQRRAVWTKPAKSSLIETILQKKPVPFFLIQKKSEKLYEVIDGQQRLRAIFDFFNNEFDLIQVDEEIKNLTYDKIEPSLLSEYDYKKLFNDYLVYFTLIENANEDEIIDMYTRVNKYTVNLNKMELKYALNHDTDFLKFVEELTYDEDILEFFLTSGIFTQKTVDRMGDIELFALIIEFILNKRLSNREDSIIDAFNNFSTMTDALKIETKNHFIETLELIKFIFQGNEFKEYFEESTDNKPQYYIKNTRFKQKNDFLSLFYVFFQIKSVSNSRKRIESSLSEIRNFLIYMDSEVAPQSDISIVSEYGIKCVSQSNTRTSREFRSKFILEGIDYIFKENNIGIMNFVNNDPLNVVSSIFEETNIIYGLPVADQLIFESSSFKDLLDVIWTDYEAKQE